MTIEIYGHLLEKEKTLSKLASTPQKVARSLSKAVGKKYLAKNLQDFEHVGPKFELLASASLTLDNCSEGSKMLRQQRYFFTLNGDSFLQKLKPTIYTLKIRVTANKTVCLCSDSSVVAWLGCLIVVKRRSRQDVCLFEYLRFPCIRRIEKCRITHKVSYVTIQGISVTLCRKINPFLMGLFSVPCRTCWGVIMDWNLLLWMDKANKDSGRLANHKIPINRDTRIEDNGDFFL